MDSSLMPIMSESPTNPQMNKSSPKKQRKQMNTSTDIKVNVLEQENKELKNQIEVLRAALIDLCKNNNTSLTPEAVAQTVLNDPKVITTI